MHFAGGIESISLVFYFLPIASFSLVLGRLGAIMVAIASSLLLNGLVLAEYFGVVEHIYRYGEATLEFSDLSVALTKSVTISIFYLIVGLFTGYGANMLFQREKSYEENNIKLGKQAKALARRDQKLSQINIELVEEKNRINSIISNFTDPIIVLDKDYRISLINPAATSVLELPVDELGKKIATTNKFSFNNFKSVVGREFAVETVEEKRASEFPVEELILGDDEQKIIYKIITARVIGSDKKNLGIMKIFQDLTREKNLDKLKTEFISIAAHQLRTPLSAIKWVIKMVVDGDAGKLNKEQQDLLDRGYKSNERVIGLVNDLLNVSRIEEGRFGYNFSKSDFDEVLNIVVADLEKNIAKNHIKLMLDKPKKLPKIYMDKERMALVMQNFLENAVKYTPEYGKIEIKIELKDNLMEVKVKDNGVGIPEKDQAKLFTKFFRASNVMRMQTKGTGLGLFIAKNIIEKHNGKIWIESEEGKGTTACFALPL
jgi:signal transduction histidine kinase